MPRPLTFLVALGLAVVAGAQSEPIVWHHDLVAATELAAARHAPLLVVFRCER